MQKDRQFSSFYSRISSKNCLLSLAVKKREISNHSEGAECGDAKWPEHPGQV